MINTLVKILINKKLVIALSKLFLGIQVKGLENIKDLQGKALFVVNHNSFIDAGLSIVEASQQSGFGTYSTFLRAYKKTYGTSPRKKAESQASLSF